MATLSKLNAQLADADDKPLIGARQSAITAAVVAHSLTDSDGSLGATSQAELEGVLDDLGTAINSIVTVLEAHGLIESND